MFRTLAVRGLLVLALLLANSTAAQVTTWDAARDFSGAQNPNGPWTYGWKASASASLTPFPTYEQFLVAYPGRDAWQDLGRSNLLGVYHNTVGVTGDIPTNMLLLQPDPLGELPVVEWTAPAAMSLHLQGMFQSLDTTASQVTVVSSVSGTRFSGAVNSATPASSFGLFLNVVAGEKIDFVASGGAAGVNVVISQLSVVGDGTIQSIAATDTRLRTNSNATGVVGGAWTFTKQRFGDGFDTTFLFQISQFTGPGADGFAFVIQNSSTTALGGGGGALGYDPVPASLAVEFDTFQNTQPGWNDPNGNHISVHTLGVNPNSAMESASIGSTTWIPNMKDGKWHVVQVHYVVQPQPQLSIYIDDLTKPVLQIAVDIVARLQLTDGTAWVGFTGATGGYTEVHDIQNWHFQSYDLHAPVLTLPANMTLEGNTVGGATVTFTTSALDAVDGPRPVKCTPASGSVFPVGNTTVNCSSSDLSGNTGNGSFVVTVTDTTPPVVVVPLSVTAAAVDHNGAPVSYIATATDIVDGAIVPACFPASGSTFALGMTTVTCSATDHAGNSASQKFSVDVTDQTPPVISSLADLQLEATGALTTVSWPAPTATDNVDGSVLVVCTPASGSQFAVGSTTVQCSATDAAGNTATKSFKVTVQDTTPPAIAGMPADMTVEATAATGAVVTWPAPSATDLVDGPVAVTCLPASGSMFPLGSTNVSCSASDAHGNPSTKKFTVSVQDTTPPAISGVPADMTLEATGPSGAVATWPAPTANDLVDGAVSVNCAPASGATFAFGQTVVTCSATDTHGNAANKAFKVTVQDTTPPAITGVPSDMTLEAAGSSGAVATWPAPTANDRVDGAVAVTCAPASGSTFPLGSTNVVCSAADAHGNKSSKQFSVTVQDTTPPVITGMPANLTLEATGSSGAVATWPAPAANDLVDGAVAVTCAPASGSTFPLGSTNVVCSAADAHGNKSTKSFSVNVQATTPLVISCGKPDGLWHAADVAIACTAHVGGSGLAKAADASFVLTTSVPAGTETANAATNSHTVCDLAGNCVTAGPIAGNAVDKRAPDIAIAAPASAAYALHQPVAASYACADGGSGVAACNGPVASGATIDTASVGARKFSVKASDNVGNGASASVSYSVGFNLCLLGRAEPKHSGSAIPVRLEVCDYAGKNVSSPALVVVAAGVVGPNGAAMPLQAAGNDHLGMRFRYIGGRTGGAYIFDLKTKGFAPGTYQLLVRVVGDSTPHAVTFQIRYRNDGDGDGDGDHDDGHRRK